MVWVDTPYRVGDIMHEGFDRTENAICTVAWVLCPCEPSCLTRTNTIVQWSGIDPGDVMISLQRRSFT
jgi:hypothetical protein